MVRLAYEAAKEGDIKKLCWLENAAEAGRIPREIRSAAKKLGSRFVKTLQGVPVTFVLDSYEKYLESRKGKTVSHACAYGVFCASIGIELEEVLRHYMYAQTSAMVTNCVKSIPLSQTVGQKILGNCYPVLQEILEELPSIGEELLYASTPGFDLRCIQHEHLYSRIYMS